MKQVSKTFEFEFDHAVDKLWAVVADTPRWGEASGLPKYQASEQLQADGSVRVFGEATLAGMDLKWEELPANWIEGLWFEQKRVFDGGPFVSMATRAKLEDRGGASGLQIELAFVPANIAGLVVARFMINAFADGVQRLLETADKLIRAESPDLFLSDFEPSLSARERMELAAEAVNRSRYGHGLTPKLLDYICERQEADLWSMRPLALARRWGARPRHVIELFLQSVRAGLLESRWDILCPRCRVSKSSTDNIAELPDEVHCDACNIDYAADFASNVELSFSPSPSIRRVEYGYFCRSGPGFTPHIKGQCTLDPGDSASLPARLAPGEYRVRTLEAGEDLAFTHRGGPLPAIRLRDNRLELEGASPPDRLDLRNCGSLRRSLVIEARDWLGDALTAEKVTTLQAFRDLFSDQVIRPGDEIAIRNISFVFSDLVDSSKMYMNLGDAGAYRQVRNHFAILGEIVRKHDGSIVKTVGDGIHAAFLEPESALRASIEMQQAMKDLENEHADGAPRIRIGINSGVSISVNLNNRLDYYGKTVNFAARLESQGAAGDISMSRDFVADPAVTNILRDYRLREHQATIKGFDAPVSVFQITP